MVTGWEVENAMMSELDSFIQHDDETRERIREGKGRGTVGLSPVNITRM